MLSVDIDVKVTIIGKSKKKFWHSKPEILKRKPQKKSKQKNSDLKNIVNKPIVVMCLITQKQYGLQTEATTERCSFKTSIPQLINT